MYNIKTMPQTSSQNPDEKKLEVSFTNGAYEQLVSLATQARKTADYLIDFYPAHEFGIFSDDAKYLLELNVLELSSLAEWKKIKQMPEIKQDHVIAYKEL